MITRLSSWLLCIFCLTLCKIEKEPRQDSKDSETVQGIESASDFPSQNLVTSEKVFPEDILDTWGYITTEVADRYHAIRSKKNYGDAGEAFYARFHLAKAEFQNHADASTIRNRIEALLKTDAGFKDYTQIVQQEGTLYSISATSNHTFLSYQPKLMDAARSYLTKQAEAGDGDAEEAF